MRRLSLDIGSNSVGSAWIDTQCRNVVCGISVFPAGVEESESKRGDPRNAKRRMTRRTRITLARRADRKRQLRLKLMDTGLLPADAAVFKSLLEETDPWTLRRNGLDTPLTPHQFGRVLLHLAQRRGALGVKLSADDADSNSEQSDDDGKVKAAIGAVRSKMLVEKARSFGEFIAKMRDTRVHKLPDSREYRDAVRNKAGNYEHCADRAMIRDEFSKLWTAQKNFDHETAKLLTDALRAALDDESGDAVWRHKGLLFGQRRQSWDLGTLGRCDLEPTERCAPHADMHASRYLVVETVNNLKIIEHGQPARPLTPDERAKIKEYLSGPLGTFRPPKRKGVVQPERTKTSVSVSDLRELMGWGKATKTTPLHFNIEADEDRQINTDWFSREIVHGAIGAAKWDAMSDALREGVNRAILRFDPEQDGDAARLKAGIAKWAGLDGGRADALVAAWIRRPTIDAKRLNMSRRAVRNLLTVMDGPAPWPDAKGGPPRWLTQIEARKVIAADATFKDATTGRTFEEEANHALTESLKSQGKPLDGKAEAQARQAAAIKRRRYATGAKGATAADRYYMGKHVLMKDGKPIIGPDGNPLAEPPPAPLISNPVVRKAIHEVRRHVVEYMLVFGCKPDEVYIELAREARMGAVESDRLLFRNRLRNRIRRDIVDHFGLDSRTPTQQRAAIDRALLCVQQGGVCPLCGNQTVTSALTPRMAADGDNCEVAHVVPKGSGGHNGLGNIVLAHTKCNRDMGRQTPREFWSKALRGGFDEGFRWVQGIYENIERPKRAEMKSLAGDALWACYFDWRDDKRKVEQFTKDVKDIQEMTQRQEAATKYATRQVMAYLADALFDGKGLPERSTASGEVSDLRRIFATDGLWTSRLRREWGLFFDPHHAKTKGLENAEEHQRKEKNRGDHRHHAIDAVVIALCTRDVQVKWENRERDADAAGINTADEEQMAKYRREHPLDPPAPFTSVKQLQEDVRLAVFGDDRNPRPICHRPAKRKLIGALHEETLFGPVIDRAGNLSDRFTAKKSVLELDPNHLRMPRPETPKEAIDRLAQRRQRTARVDAKSARKWARAVVSAPGFKPAIVDPSPDKSGLIRDVDLRRRIRDCLSRFLYVKRNKAGEAISDPRPIDPDNFSEYELKQAFEAGAIRHRSGVPIRSVVLLRTIADPVIVSRARTDYQSGRRVRDPDPAALRAYVGGNNHHIEIRAARDRRGSDALSGVIVTAHEAAQRKLARLRALRAAGVPRPSELRKLPESQRRSFRKVLAEIDATHPIVNRHDSDELGGRFIMSLSEGETLLMRHKNSGELGYFVVAKLDKPHTAVVVPHWDARAATERKDAEGNKVSNSKREQFAVTPNDLCDFAPSGEPHAVKVHIGPLGDCRILRRD